MHFIDNHQITIVPDSATDSDLARTIADQYDLEYSPNRQPSTPYRLVVSASTITLQLASTPLRIVVDYTQGHAAHRRQFGGGLSQTLAKAIGLKKGHRPNVLDGTAGYGYDAFVLASLGCQVTLVERHSVLIIMLRHALKQALSHAITQNIAQRMTVEHADTFTLLTLKTAPVADVIYLDPMYPSRTKSAQVKKEMQLLHQLLANEGPNAGLLAIARKRAKKRVVVKRPISAEYLDDLIPHSQVKSKNTRYDIYLPTSA